MVGVYESGRGSTRVVGGQNFVKMVEGYENVNVLGNGRGSTKMVRGSTKVV